MKIDQFQLEPKADRIRASAMVTWEDCDRPAQEIFFQTDIEFADDFSCNPHAFLIGCTLPAMRFGEKRILLEEEICPELKNGLVTVMSLVRHWMHNPKKELVRIEAKRQSKPVIESENKRTGFFISGGIDSLGNLKDNHLNYPSGHPGYIKDGLLVYGLEVFKPDKFLHVVRSISEIARDAGIKLIPVYTNIRNLGPEEESEFWSDFWINEYMGAAFASIAHTFTKRFSTICLSLDQDIPNVISPYGNHLLLNPNYSSSDLSFKCVGMTLSRFQKTKLIANWDAALQHLRVCNISFQYESEVLNCGICEKCLRTKLALLALDVLDRTNAFANKDISPELLQSMINLTRVSLTYYNNDLIDALLEKKHQDLVKVIKRKIKEFKWRERTIHPIKKFDHKYLNDTLLGFKKSFGRPQV